MRAFRFLHAADIHLDSPFRGLTVDDPSICERIRRSTFDAFDNLVTLAIDRHVDFVVIAGDVYDGADRSIRAQLHFRAGLARLTEANVPTFIAHGNHDPLDSRISTIAWPDRVRVFSGDEVETVLLLQEGEPLAALSGFSFPTRQVVENVIAGFRRSSDSLFHVGVLHCNVGANPEHDPYAPCSVADLVATGIDYWALGHVHTRQVLHTSPHVVYPGNVQGRHIKELGPRGCMLVEVDEAGAVKTTFEPLDAVRWARLEVAIDDVTTIDEVERRLHVAIDGASGKADKRPLLCRATITGRSTLHRELAHEAAAGDLLERARDTFADRSPFVWVEAVEIACRPEVDIADRRRADDLLGQVLRAANDVRRDPEQLGRLQNGALMRLFGSAKVRKADLEVPTYEELLELLEQAELLCVDRLEAAQ